MANHKKLSSPFYSSPTLYNLLIRLLYRGHFNSRYQLIADLIPNNSSVVDVCAGEARLFRNYLKKKSVQYIGVDNSPFFTEWARKKGIDYRNLNVFSDQIPKADYAIMMGSLFQFHPREKEVLQKLILAARRKVIISEPISNVSSSNFGFLARLANQLTIPFDAPSHYTGERFNEKRLNSLFISIQHYEHSIKTPGGREMIGVFSGQG